MAHLWLRAERRPNERRAPLTPAGAAELIAAGTRVTVEACAERVFAIDDYAAAGCGVAEPGGWSQAPADAVILGLKELPDDGAPLRHAHAMFGHAYKGQIPGRRLLERFAAGGGVLLDLESLTDGAGRRLAAFGRWAGFAGAALALQAWAAQRRGRPCPPAAPHDSAAALAEQTRRALEACASEPPSALIAGALGRCGTGAAELCGLAGIDATKWDVAQTAHGGPFDEILAHDVFVNCILAGPGAPVFVPESALAAPRRLSVVGDVACDPGSEFNPVPVCRETTSWERPAARVHGDPPLDVVAIDNLPSILPRDSSEDFAAALLPLLAQIGEPDAPAWARARAAFDAHIKEIHP